MNTEFQRLTRLRHLTEAGIRNANEELKGINEALVALSGIKVGDVIPKYSREPDGDKVLVNTIAADVFFLDDTNTAYLRVRGFCSPLTKAGVPHKNIRWNSWMHIVKDVSMPIDEYKHLAKLGE